tara:strand:- start:142 stop:444 length:303 start_codon:yes stop_codon:yes gene_type:complete
MSQKKLQEKSNFSDLDVDGDGVVSDHELSVVEAHDQHRKYKTQERITIGTAISMLVFTVAMFFAPETRIAALTQLSSLFYISGAGVISAFFGFQAMGQRK